MIRDITIGQYYRAESLIHRLDPRVKLGGTILYIISLFVFSQPLGFALAATFLILVIILAKVPIGFIVKGLKPVVLLIGITVMFNLFWTPGEAALQIWKITITWEGIESAAFLGARFILLILGSTIMTLTTTPTQLTDGIESMLKVLKFIKVPAHEIAMMMSIALRFIPILLEETDKIMKAQQARCADFETGNIVRRAKSMLPVLIPLFVSAFRRANDLAMAMEARCYQGGKGRTRMKPLCYQSRDYAAYGVIILYFIINGVFCFVI